MTTIDVVASDISCEHCKRSIEEHLGAAAGVRSVTVDVAARAVHVDYDDTATSAESIRSKLDEIGYPSC